jgi:hypothetical protein
MSMLDGVTIREKWIVTRWWAHDIEAWSAAIWLE